MNKKRKTMMRIISLLSILASAILFSMADKRIVGFAIADISSTQLNYFLAAILFIVGLVIFLLNGIPRGD